MCPLSATYIVPVDRLPACLSPPSATGRARDGAGPLPGWREQHLFHSLHPSQFSPRRYLAEMPTEWVPGETALFCPNFLLARGSRVHHGSLESSRHRVETQTPATKPRLAGTLQPRLGGSKKTGSPFTPGHPHSFPAKENFQERLQSGVEARSRLCPRPHPGEMRCSCLCGRLRSHGNCLSPLLFPKRTSMGEDPSGWGE